MKLPGRYDTDLERDFRGDCAPRGGGGFDSEAAEAVGDTDFAADVPVADTGGAEPVEVGTGVGFAEDGPALRLFTRGTAGDAAGALALFGCCGVACACAGCGGADAGAGAGAGDCRCVCGVAVDCLLGMRCFCGWEIGGCTCCCGGI